jgi:hypothetical protein
MVDMKNFLFLASLLTMAWACNSGGEAPTVTEEEAPTPVAAEMVYAIICKDISQPNDNTPHHEVYAIVGRDTVFVGNMESCAKIAPEDYAQYQVPEDAFEAVGGSLTDKIVYAAYIGKSPEGKITARIGNMYKGKPGATFAWRSMVVFEEKDIIPVSEVSPSALVGSYIHSGSESSHVLYLGFSNRTIVGQVFAFDGPFPTHEDSLMMAIAKTAPELIPAIDVEYSDLSFTSAMGKGKFTQSGGRIESMVFSSWKGGKSLVFEKKEIGHSGTVR